MDWSVSNHFVTETSYPYTSGYNGTTGGCIKAGHTAAAANVTGYLAVNQSEAVIAAFLAKYSDDSLHPLRFWVVNLRTLVRCTDTPRIEYGGSAYPISVLSVR